MTKPPMADTAGHTSGRRHVEHDLLLAALPHPVAALGEDERLIYANPAAEAFFSASLAVLRRMTLAELVGATCPLVNLVQQVRRSKGSVNEYGIEVTMPRIDGVRLVDVYSGPVPEQPEVTLLMLQQRSMAQMIERQLTHRASARSVSGMADVLAHEIKNPLSGIRGAAQLLETDLPDEGRALTQLICAETDRIRDLVDRMEVFGDERPLATQPVNIHSVLDHVRRLAETGFAASIQVAAEYDPSLPPIPGNRDKLIQAFLNLVKNAAESILERPDGSRGDPGRIVLRTAFRPGVRMMVPGASTRVALPLMIEIEDNGQGVADHVKQHLFDPFVTTKRRGSGLGLALVAKIIRDHGGVIEFETERKRTIFRALLPMQPAAAQPKTEKKGPGNG
jgi:two-component system, NtrC family, nitrogen regulation sensor histidine kinase GlnL